MKSYLRSELPTIRSYLPLTIPGVRQAILQAPGHPTPELEIRLHQRSLRLGCTWVLEPSPRSHQLGEGAGAGPPAHGECGV